MYAVIESGSKQYRVEPGDVIDVELTAVSKAKKPKVSFDRVLLVRDGDTVRVGAPHVKGVKVTGELVERTRGPKILVFKKKRRKGYRRLRGHRQELMRVRIAKIEG